MVPSIKEMQRASAKASRPDRRNPCALCGWGRHMAVHLPVVSGPREGQPWGHQFVATKQQDAG